MADNLMTFGNVIENIVPKVTIQRIILETSALNNPKEQGDPHAMAPDIPESFKNPTVSSPTSPDSLKVDLIFSLKAFQSKSLSKDNPLINVFNNLDLLNVVKSTLYQINEVSIQTIVDNASSQPDVTVDTGLDGPIGMGTGLGGGPLGGGLGLGNITKAENAFNDLSILELYQSIQKTPNLFYQYEFDIWAELNSIVTTGGQEKRKKGDLLRFQSVDSDGSISYNFPFKPPFHLSMSKDTKFLAYMVVTEIDTDKLIQGIIQEIGGDAGFQLPKEVEEYIKQYSDDPANKSITLDVVINDGGVNKTGALLQRDDNEEYWFGPYHQMPNGTLMTGAKHNDKNLSPDSRDIILNPVLLANTKIVDLRDDDEIEKIFLKQVYEIETLNDKVNKFSKQKKKSDKNPLEEMPEKFSTSYKSTHSDGSCSYLFGIDKFKILQHKSAIPAIAQNLANSEDTTISGHLAQVQKDVLDATNLKYIKIFRRRVKITDFGENRLGTLDKEQESFKHNFLSADVDNSYEDSKFIEIASRDELANNPTVKNIDALNFLDNSMKEKRYVFHSFRDYSLATLKTGNYSYSYELVFEDGIPKILTEKLKILMVDSDRVKRYLKFINENVANSYNESLDQFNSAFITNSQYSNIPANLQNIVNTMVQTIVMFDTSSMSSLANFGADLVLIAHPASGNYQGLLKFIKIVDTFIDKMQKFPGVITELEKYLDLGINGLQNNFTEIPHTIKINETFPDLASLDDYGTGYEYIVPTSEMDSFLQPYGKDCIRTIPVATFQGIMNQQLQENFLLTTANTSFGGPSDPNLPRYFKTAQVFVANKRYKTNSTSESGSPAVQKPYQLNFEYYKPIMLDIIEYYLNMQSEGKFIAYEEKSNIKRLLNIASRYGIIFSDDFINNLEFLSDSITNTSEENNKFFSSSKVKDLQHQSSQNQDLSGIDFEDETNPAADYEDTNITDNFKEINIENFLFGMLSGIILKSESSLTSAYINPPISALGGEFPEVLSNWPPFVQALSFQFADIAGDLSKEFLAGDMNLSYLKFRELPISLATIGWWWLNYSNVVQVRYISSYDSFFNPIWAPLTLEALTNVLNGKRIICKLYKYENNRIGIGKANEFLDLPMLNKHFILEPGVGLQITSLQTEEEIFAINREDDSDLKQSNVPTLSIVLSDFGNDLNSNIISDLKVIRNKNAKVLGDQTPRAKRKKKRDSTVPRTATAELRITDQINESIAMAPINSTTAVSTVSTEVSAQTPSTSATVSMSDSMDMNPGTGISGPGYN